MDVEEHDDAAAQITPDTGGDRKAAHSPRHCEGTSLLTHCGGTGETFTGTSCTACRKRWKTGHAIALMQDGRDRSDLKEIYFLQTPLNHGISLLTSLMILRGDTEVNME